MKTSPLKHSMWHKQLGLICIYDLPIAYWQTGRRLMMEEAQRMPSWAITLGGGIKDSEEKLKRKTQELELADVVVVPGSFVKDSLPDWAGNKKIIVAPFGSPDTPPGHQIERTSTKLVLYAFYLPAAWDSEKDLVTYSTP